MVKPKLKLSKLVIVGVTTHTMCFNCYCHQHSVAIKPYQRLAKRRKAIRYRSRSGLPFKYRFAIFPSARHDTNASWWQSGQKVSCSSMNLHWLLFFFHYLFNRKSGDSSGSRQIRNTPDWSDNAVAGDHLWVPTSVSGDCCYVGDNDCTVSSFTSWPSFYVLQCFSEKSFLFITGAIHMKRHTIRVDEKRFNWSSIRRCFLKFCFA